MRNTRGKMDIINKQLIKKNSIKKFKCKDYHVLVVDDNAISRKVIHEMLNGYGILPDEASNGQMAIMLARDNKYDMIFMDHMMPGMDGVETARHILEDCKKSMKTPIIIALTANAAKNAKEMYIKKGFCDFMSKPFGGEQLCTVLNKWISEDKKQYLYEEEKKTVFSEIELIKIFMSGIDVVSAIKQYGSIEAYLELLDLFYTDGVQKIKLLEEFIDKEDINNYIIEVHGLKSAAANIGANKLSELAKQHEEYGKNFDFKYIEENKEALFNCYNKILSEIKRVLVKQEYGQFAKKKAVELIQIEKQDMIMQIENIIHQLEMFESKEAAKGVEKLLGYAIPDIAKTQLEEVQTMLKMYEDDKAEEMLKKLIDNL